MTSSTPFDQEDSKDNIEEEVDAEIQQAVVHRTFPFAAAGPLETSNLLWNLQITVKKTLIAT